MERGFLERLIRYWRDDYEWPDRVAMLNRLPHFHANTDGYGIHFLHFKSGNPSSKKNTS